MYVIEYSRSLDVDKPRRNILSDDLLTSSLSASLPFTVNPEMLLLFKTFTTLEGVCKSMYPEFNYFTLSQTMMTQLISVTTLTKKMANDVDKMMSIMMIPSSSSFSSDFPPQQQRPRGSTLFSQLDYKSELRDMEHERKHNMFVTINLLGILVNLMGML